jgi:hypothetical protein
MEWVPFEQYSVNDHWLDQRNSAFSRPSSTKGNKREVDPGVKRHVYPVAS